MKENFEKGRSIYEAYITKNNRKPTETEWNKIAKERRLLSSTSMRYIGNITFKKRNYLV